MAIFRTLYSGSSGNCAVLSEGSTVLLIDVGKNCRATVEALADAGIPASSVSGVLLTHEHSDHISGLPVFLKHYPVPVFGPRMTLEYLRCNTQLPYDADLIPLEPDAEMLLGGTVFSGFRTYHDSLDCFGYQFWLPDGRRAAVATDLGCVPEELLDRLGGCDFIAIESNYDEGMLKFGRYPLYLKRRIASRQGHLSNLDCAGAVTKLAESGTGKFMLMHLSAENNAPEMALTACFGRLEDKGVSGCSVVVAPRSALGDAVSV